jgi:hypothetical protein
MSDIRHSERIGANFHQSSASGHDDLNRARQAAETLFAPRRQIENPTNLDATGSTQQDQRKPRILSAVREQQPQAAAHVESPRLKHETRRPRKRVPVSHLARARTWLKYGMTIGQAADIYGVSESEIERILQKA